MDFTREPIIETIITPREGCKLVIRRSNSAGQEEFFIDAVEVVSFGQALFFRSLEKPKPFLVPISDYEVLEVKEARMALKHTGHDKAIKIGGGREVARPAREEEKSEEKEFEVEAKEAPAKSENESEAHLERKRERRRPQRRRRDRESTSEEESSHRQNESAASVGETQDAGLEEKKSDKEPSLPAAPNFSGLLAPPPQLISETIARYRDDQTFKNAFFLTEEEEYKPHSQVEALLNEDDEPKDKV